MRKGRKKLVGAVLLSASVVGGTVSLPEKVIAEQAVQVAEAQNEDARGIPYIGKGNKTQDHHNDEHHNY